MQHLYVFTHNSKVFHTAQCRVIQKSKELDGCRSYAAAAKTRRPCKLCKPQMPKPDESAFPDISDKVPTLVQLMDNSPVWVVRQELVGYCDHSLHPGEMTAELLIQHRCLAKQCPYLIKYPNSFYFRKLHTQRNKEKKRRDEKVSKKHKKALHRQETLAQEKRVRFVKEEIQYYMDLCEYNVEVIEVKEQKPNCYKVFYVSDSTYNDWRQYPEFYATMSHIHPHWQLCLQHIRDAQGHYVTIDEFYKRKGENI